MTGGNLVQTSRPTGDVIDATFARELPFASAPLIRRELAASLRAIPYNQVHSHPDFARRQASPVLTEPQLDADCINEEGKYRWDDDRAERAGKLDPPWRRKKHVNSHSKEDRKAISGCPKHNPCGANDLSEHSGILQRQFSAWHSADNTPHGLRRMA